MAVIRRKKQNLGYYTISKITILKRLHTAGKYEAARQALDQMDAFMNELWNAANEIRSDDSQVIALLTGIGANVDVILAKE